VALGDVNRDNVPDLILAAGPGGGPHIRVLDGKSGAPIKGPLGSFFAYNAGFTGGVFVASGDVNRDGFDDIITGADAGGGPHVRVFSGESGGLLYDFFAFSAGFTGGVRVAAGDVDGDGFADIITAAGPGGGPHVMAFSGQTGEPIASFYAYDARFTGGVFVAAGDVNGDHLAEFVTGAGGGGGPHVEAFSGQTLAPLASFFAYNSGFTGGVRVAVGDLDGDGKNEIITGAGPGGGPHVRAFELATQEEVASFFAYQPAFTGGVFVAGYSAGASPLRLAGASATAGQHADRLTTESLASIFQAAVSRFEQAGLEAWAVQRLQSLELRIDDLASDLLGLATDNAIWLDADAAGQGWFIDPTPFDDGEFALLPAAGGQQQLEAASRVDLLTALSHELGHVLGLGHADPSALMGAELAGGVRKPISARLVDELYSSSSM
jgi:hypothetical protein